MVYSTYSRRHINSPLKLFSSSSSSIISWWFRPREIPLLFVCRIVFRWVLLQKHHPMCHENAVSPHSGSYMFTSMSLPVALSRSLKLALDSRRASTSRLSFFAQSAKCCQTKFIGAPEPILTIQSRSHPLLDTNSPKKYTFAFDRQSFNCTLFRHLCPYVTMGRALGNSLEL